MTNDKEAKRLLENLDFESLEELLAVTSALSEKYSKQITTDDDLHQFIIDELGVNIPRVAVCSGHNAPFEFIADLFFGRVNSAIVVAARGSGKTMDAAIWHYINMKTTPGTHCISVGAQEIQAKRCYSYFKEFQRKGARDLIDTSLISETRWITGSKLEVLTGSKSSVNGPHVGKVHRDEAELMEREIYQESLGIERSQTTSDGEVIHAQSLLTSTRKTSFGLMQELLDECAQAEREGRKPPHKVYIFCIKEVVQTQPNCCVTYPDLPEEEKCECNLIQAGEWEEDKPRTLDQICDGAFSRSQGFTPLADIQKTFAATSKAMWEAQYECKRPYAEDITLDTFSIERHGIREFEPDINNGLIFTGIDIGGTSPHAVEWMQLLDFQIEVLSSSGQPKILPEGSIVVFDELYKAEWGNVELAEQILLREQWWRNRYPGFKITTRFVDPQAKVTRKDFAHHKPQLQCSWPAVTRDREEHLKRTRTRINNGTFYIDIERCPMFIEEVSVWNINKPRKAFDHAVDATLYGVSNIHSLVEEGIRRGPPEQPSSRPRQPQEMPEVRISGPERELFEEDRNWRASMYKSIE